MSVSSVEAIGDLVVMHISSKRSKYLIPTKFTQTHVAVQVHGLCKFGILRSKRRKQRPFVHILGQVLLFLEPCITDTEHRLWVFLLPRNVPPSEVQQLTFAFLSLFISERIERLVFNLFVTIWHRSKSSRRSMSSSKRAPTVF